MRRLPICVGILLLASFSFATSWAYDFGTNITIWDRVGTGAGFYGGQEDQEVEPGNFATQAWDLEAFYLKGTQLTMIGGFDFVNGVKDPYYAPRDTSRLPLYGSGDIFLATEGTPIYGPGALPNLGGNAVVKNLNGYNYAVELDFVTRSYTVHAIDPSSEVKVGWFQSNYSSNPWSYHGGGKEVASGGMVLIGYDEKGVAAPLSDEEIGNGLLGGFHFGLTIDLSFLAPGTEFYAHFTQQCGNDNLMGQGQVPVPEPATMFLLGTGLAALGYLGRKRRLAPKTSM